MRKLGVLLIALWSISVFGQSSSVESSQKRPLTHADYDQWESIKSYGVDAMGDLAFAIVTPQEGDGYLGVYQLASGQEIARIPRVTRADWLPNTVCLLVKQDPPEAEIRQLKLKKTKKEDLPQAQAYLLTFASGAATGIARIYTLGAINRCGIQEGYDEKEVIKDEIILERPAKDKEKPSVDFLSILMDYDVLEENDTMEFVMG